MKIENRSKWPTPALRVLCKWIVKREPDLPDHYAFLFRATNDRHSWRGVGWKSRQTVRLSRRHFGPYPYTKKDHRFKWSVPFEFRSRLETLVYLIAHEAHHSTKGHPREFEKSNGRTDRAAMEFHCNNAGFEAVKALRIEWPTLRTKIYAAMRRERDRLKTSKQHDAIRRSDPTPKLLNARESLVTWRRKAKLAATKIKKYRRKVAYYEGRMAATLSTN
jgi:hypothetical protein